MRTLACLSLLLLTAVVSLADAAELKVGVLRLEDVYTEADFVAAATEQLQTQATQVNQTMEELVGQIENQEKLIAIEQKGTQAHYQAQEKLEVLKLRHKMYFENQKRRLDAAEISMLGAAYERITEELAAFAKAQELDLVLKSSPGRIGSRNITDFRNEVAAHSVLFHQDSLDITKPFVAFLNERVATDFFMQQEQAAGSSAASIAVEDEAAADEEPAPLSNPTIAPVTDDDSDASPNETDGD